MRLDYGMYEPLLLKEDLLIYCKELIKALKIKVYLIEQSFHSMLLGDKDIHYYDLRLGDYVYWKQHLHEDTLQLQQLGSY